MPRFRSLAVVAVLAACTDLPSTYRPPIPTTGFRLAAADAWSGGDIDIFSSFVLPSALPAVTVGGQVEAVTRVNDTTLRAVVPRVVGTMPVVVTGTEDTLKAAVTLHGFEAMGTMFGVWGNATQLPGVPAAVIANG